MTTLKRATNSVFESLNMKYTQLEPSFLADLREYIETAFKPFVRNAGKERSQRGTTAFNMFVKEFTAKHKDDKPVVKGGKLVTMFKLASDEWKALKPEKRAEYQSKADELNASNGVVKAKDRVKPKKRVSGYNVFVVEYRSKHGNEPDLFKKASAEWKSLSDAQKTEYNTKAQQQNVENGVEKKSE